MIIQCNEIVPPRRQTNKKCAAIFTPDYCHFVTCAFVHREWVVFPLLFIEKTRILFKLAAVCKIWNGSNFYAPETKWCPWMAILRFFLYLNQNKNTTCVWCSVFGFVCKNISSHIKYTFILISICHCSMETFSHTNQRAHSGFTHNSRNICVHIFRTQKK